MNKTLEAWINQKLTENKLSLRKLASEMETSHSHLSRVLSGETSATLNFYRGLSKALDEPLESILRMDGVLPDVGDDPSFAEILELTKQLSYRERRALTEYIRLRLKLEREEQDS